jgi:DNA-binding HxlR family transcriptional regulator
MERRLRNDQAEIEQRLMQRIMDQQRQLAEKDREWAMLLLRREHESDRRFQDLASSIKTANSNNTRLEV